MSTYVMHVYNACMVWFVYLPCAHSPREQVTKTLQVLNVQENVEHYMARVQRMFLGRDFTA